MSDDTVQLSVRIPKRLQKALKVRAIEQETTMGALLQEALRGQLKAEGAK